MKTLLIMLIFLLTGCATNSPVGGMPYRLAEFPSECVACEQVSGPFDWADYATDK